MNIKQILDIMFLIVDEALWSGAARVKLPQGTCGMVQVLSLITRTFFDENKIF